MSAHSSWDSPGTENLHSACDPNDREREAARILTGSKCDSNTVDTRDGTVSEDVWKGRHSRQRRENLFSDTGDREQAMQGNATSFTIYV